MKIAIVGDMFFGGEFQNSAQRKSRGVEYYFGEVRSALAGADLRLGNLECCLLENKRKRTKDWLLYCTPENGDILNYVGFDAVSIGNNHIGDLEEEGVRETASELAKRNIYSVGAGLDDSPEHRWAKITRANHVVAFGSYCDPNIPGTVCATDNKFGAAKFDLELALTEIKKIKAESDIVIVSIHWGEQYFDYPSPQQVSHARAMIDAGAAIIMGHHPHVLQGYEQYNGGAIFYSLGNFFMPDFRLQTGEVYRYPAKSKIFLIGMLSFDGGKLTGIETTRGYMQKDFALRLYQKHTNEPIDVRSCRLSAPLQSDSYEEFWAEYKPIGDNTALEDEKRFYRTNFIRRLAKRGLRGNIDAINRKLSNLAK